MIPLDASYRSVLPNKTPDCWEVTSLTSMRPIKDRIWIREMVEKKILLVLDFYSSLVNLVSNCRQIH